MRSARDERAAERTERDRPRRDDAPTPRTENAPRTKDRWRNRPEGDPRATRPAGVWRDPSATSPRNAERPKGNWREQPQRSERPAGTWRERTDDRPARTERPQGTWRERTDDRPARTERPQGTWREQPQRSERPAGTWRERPQDDRPARTERPQGTWRDQPQRSERPAGTWRERPQDDRPARTERPQRDAASHRERPASGRGAYASGRKGPRSDARRTPPPAPVMRGREPREAATSFSGAGLPQTLVTTLERRGMHEPFAVQAAALPDAIAGEHLLVRARTGAGKTLGFGLPMLTRLAASSERAKPKKPRGLIMTPTRELAMQVAASLSPLAQPLGLKLRTVVGGAPMGRQIENLKYGADIVVATPGRLTDLVERGFCDLSEVVISVLDEADHMCDLGFFPVVTELLAMVPADGQRMLFSATLDGDVEKLAERFLPDPVLVATDPEVSAVEGMEHRPLLVADATAKLEVVTALAGGSRRAIVFTRTKMGADRLAMQLAQAGVAARALHGGLQQNARTRALQAFTTNPHGTLVATDVMARGIHVDGVELVVHADPPTEPKAYLHRSGRTARAGAEGTVVVVALPYERRSVERLLTAAGVQAKLTEVAPGDEVLTEIAGPPVDPATLAAEAEQISREARADERPRREARPPRRPSGDRPERPWRERPHRDPATAGSARPTRRPQDGERPQRDSRPDWKPRTPGRQSRRAPVA